MSDCRRAPSRSASGAATGRDRRVQEGPPIRLLMAATVLGMLAGAILTKEEPVTAPSPSTSAHAQLESPEPPPRP